ncbi:cytochrome P450 2J4-like isoform X3 [Rattus norvegicus]|uniref:cytochrome P450 2J4-like isoform X3 n=1 Tax=Rattus norvegicus TaxID=10116 RepID=UPI002FD800C0
MLATVGSLLAKIWSAINFWTLLLTLLTFLLLADYLKNRRPNNYPPGPWRLPFVGNLFQFDLNISHLHLRIQQFVKKYGNLISLDFGNISVVVITGLPLIKEALINNEQNFLKRPIVPSRYRVFKDNGIFFANVHKWKEQRRFALTMLKNFGLGKKSLEQCIQEEAHHLVEVIGEEKGQPFDPHFRINNAVSNIICSITFGERFEYDDSQFQELLKLADEVICSEASMTSVYPDKTTTSFNEENLIATTLDLFFAGTETTSTTLRWALLYITLNPEVQEKVHSEIDRVIGHGRLPSTDDQDAMPYTNAVIHEVLRMGNIIPLNVPREVTADSTLAGFHLPKGKMILTNLTALHRDPKEWATPDTFNPEHFLENGQFKKRDSFLPFSVGKRACPGEKLAKSELFIFFTALMQNFTFKAPTNEKLSLKLRKGLSLYPVSYRICAVPR